MLDDHYDRCARMNDSVRYKLTRERNRIVADRAPAPTCRARSLRYVALVQVRPGRASAPDSCRFGIRTAHSCAHPAIAEARILAPLPFEPEREKAPTSITATEFPTAPWSRVLTDDVHPGRARQHRHSRHLRAARSVPSAASAANRPQKHAHDRRISATVGVQFVLVRSQQGCAGDAIGPTLR